jgi:hypothetical protein
MNLNPKMKSKIMLFLALVLSGILSGCDHRSVVAVPPMQITDRATEQPSYIEENQILGLKDRLWDAVRTKNAAKFVGCYFIEERFDNSQVRDANRKQVETFLQGEIVDMEVFEIPPNELDQIMKIQNTKPDSLVRYSLVPKKILNIRCKTERGWTGWRLLIGNKNGKWYVVTLAGYTT